MSFLTNTCTALGQQVFLLTPPFTQLNTPYPATAYLKGFLNTLHIPSHQADIGIEVINSIFSTVGLQQLFERIKAHKYPLAPNEQRILGLASSYIKTIDPVMQFLKNKNPTLAHTICTGNYLPQASRFNQLADLEWAFGNMGIMDKARHLCTLYLEDLGDLIAATVDPHFGFSRYAERLASSAHTFDEMYLALKGEQTYTDEILADLLIAKIHALRPTMVAISVPFPGNLYSALRCGHILKQHFPTINICMGGGYPNTELRQLQDPRIFEFIDYITLDDGERCIEQLIEHLDGRRDKHLLKRTFLLEDGAVVYYNGSLSADYKQVDVGTPDYTGLPSEQYISVIEIANPMHRLWSDGRWNKLTLAHGCYWGKCTFCDISLDYIRNYEASSASILVDRMEAIIEQTGERGFHFVDEAAPPALMKAVAIEILKRSLTITWWTNIRFEKSFTADLCRLLAASGCIAVSGGLEVASERILALINKGVSLEQVAQVTDNFTEAGIMVHAYLMYGFPTQTDQETIDSLEVVRQMFEANIIQSGFWHQFAMTAHSPVGMNPAAFQVESLLATAGPFAHNDLPHADPTGADHARYAAGLKKAIFNYMHGICFDYPLQAWFDFKVKPTTMPPYYIQCCIERKPKATLRSSTKVLWTGVNPTVKLKQQSKHNTIAQVTCHHIQETVVLRMPVDYWNTFSIIIEQCQLASGGVSVQALEQLIREKMGVSLSTFIQHPDFETIQMMGLYLL